MRGEGVRGEGEAFYRYCYDNMASTDFQVNCYRLHMFVQCIIIADLQLLRLLQ